MLPLTLNSTIVHRKRVYIAAGRRVEAERRNYVTVLCEGKQRRYWFEFSRRRPFCVALLKRAIDRFISEGAES